jgi:hypothetical protein
LISRAAAIMATEKKRMNALHKTSHGKPSGKFSTIEHSSRLFSFSDIFIQNEGVK